MMLKRTKFFGNVKEEIKELKSCQIPNKEQSIVNYSRDRLWRPTGF
jgi:hypothetical protein